MRLINSFAALMLLTAAPAFGQPIIIPLESQPKPTPPPVASAPPVAPPIASPTQPETAFARGEPGADGSTPREEASQPLPKEK